MIRLSTAGLIVGLIAVVSGCGLASDVAELDVVVVSSTTPPDLEGVGSRSPESVPGTTALARSAIPKGPRAGLSTSTAPPVTAPPATVVLVPSSTTAVGREAPEPTLDAVTSTTVAEPEDPWCFSLDLLAVRGYEFAKSVRSDDAGVRAGGVAGLQEVIDALLDNPPREVANRAAALATELNRVVVAARQGAGSEAEIRAAAISRMDAVSPLVDEVLALASPACPRAEAATVEAGEGFDVLSERDG